NALRAQGLPLREAILQGAEKRVRPVMMTALTAILGLLPAALAMRLAWDADWNFRWVEQVGSQTQRPLAIVRWNRGQNTGKLASHQLRPSRLGEDKPR